MLNSSNSMDEIRIEGLETFGHHGIYQPRKIKGQHFIINAVLYTDFRDSGMQDDLARTVDYGKVCDFICEWMENNSCKLIETVAELLAKQILIRYYDYVRAADIEIFNPEAPIKQNYGRVSAKVSRAWHTAYIGVGSNHGDREAHINNGIEAMKKADDIKVMQISRMREYAPYGIKAQDDFLNGVVRIETLLSPQELLRALQAIEKAEKDEVTVRHGPRKLDLDIILYDRVAMEDYYLIIPHVDMQNRDFVLKPMCELSPWLRHPVLNKTMVEMLRAVETEGEIFER